MEPCKVAEARYQLVDYRELPLGQSVVDWHTDGTDDLQLNHPFSFPTLKLQEACENIPWNRLC